MILLLKSDIILVVISFVIKKKKDKSNIGKIETRIFYSVSNNNLKLNED